MRAFATQVCGQQRQETVEPSPAAEQPVAAKDPLTHFGCFCNSSQVSGQQRQETVELSPTAEQQPVAEKDPF